jgi:hypothetical protein
MTEIRKRRFSCLNDDNEDENDDNSLPALTNSENLAGNSSVTMNSVTNSCDEQNYSSEQSREDGEEDIEDDEDFAQSGDNDYLIGKKGKAMLKVNPPDVTFSNSYELLEEQAKLCPFDRCFIRLPGRGRPSYQEFEDSDSLLDFLGENCYSVTHISKAELDKIYVTSGTPSTTTQILRNLLEEGPYLRKHPELDYGTHPKARKLTEDSGNLKLETIERNLLLFRKRSKKGVDTGEKMFGVFNNDEAPAGVEVDTSEQNLFIIFFTTTQLLKSEKKNNYPFHELFMILLRSQVLIFFYFLLHY